MLSLLKPAFLVLSFSEVHKPLLHKLLSSFYTSSTVILCKLPNVPDVIPFLALCYQ